MTNRPSIFGDARGSHTLPSKHTVAAPNGTGDATAPDILAAPQPNTPEVSDDNVEDGADVPSPPPASFNALLPELRQMIFGLLNTRHVVRITADPGLQPVGHPDGTFDLRQTRVFATPQSAGWVNVNHESQLIAQQNRSRLFARQAPSTNGVPFDLQRDTLYMVNGDALIVFLGGRNPTGRGHRPLVRRHAGIRYLAIGGEKYGASSDLMSAVANFYDLDTIYLRAPAEPSGGRMAGDYYTWRWQDAVDDFRLTYGDGADNDRVPHIEFLNTREWIDMFGDQGTNLSDNTPPDSPEDSPDDNPDNQPDEESQDSPVSAPSSPIPTVYGA